MISSCKVEGKVVLAVEVNYFNELITEITIDKQQLNHQYPSTINTNLDSGSCSIW